MQVEASETIEPGWFRRQSTESIEYQHPEEGKDWNTYFQYEAHKNLLKELPEDEDENQHEMRCSQMQIRKVA